MPERKTALVAATALFIAAICVLVWGVVMALAMGSMDGMGMMGGRNSSPQTPAVASEQSVTIEMRDFAFSPRDLTVNAGAMVTWANHDAAPHDATADDKGWRTDILTSGGSAIVTFDAPGTYGYHCSIHPYMTATLIVQ